MVKVKYLILWALIGLLSVSNSHAEQLNQLRYVTETYPPYNFKEGGTLKGIAIDLLLSATEVAGSPVKQNGIQLLPWARAFKMAETEKNVVLFSTTRTEQREAKFQWVGPISPTRVVLLAKKDSNIKIDNPEELSKYQIGVIRDDIGDHLVKSLGVSESNITRSSKADALIKMLDSGRVQMWAYEENVARWLIKKESLNNDHFSVAYVLKESELYYAFSKDVSKTLVNQLQEAVNKVKSGSQFDEIKRRY